MPQKRDTKLPKYSNKHGQAAIRIQSVFRGYRSRKLETLYQLSATRIQSAFRGHRIRKSFQHRKSMTIQQKLLSKEMHSTQNRIEILEKEMKELSLANRTRMRIWDAERRDRAARLIQKHVRGLLTRNILSRPGSPIKNEAHHADDMLPADMPIDFWDPIEEEQALKETIQSITRRMLKDQFHQESLLGMYGSTSREMTTIREQVSKTQSATAQTVISKLRTLEDLLDQYYGKEDVILDAKDDPGRIHVQLLQDCHQLRDETQGYIDLLEKGKHFMRFHKLILSSLGCIFNRNTRSIIKDEITKSSTTADATRARTEKKTCQSELVGSHANIFSRQ